MTAATTSRRGRRRNSLRRVLILAIVALVLGAAAVALLEFDQALARNGRGGHVPQQSWTVVRWFVVVIGGLAIALWVGERRRSHARVSAGVVIAVFAVTATPIALEIVHPDDTPMTVVAFSARTGQQRWQREIGLVSTAMPMRSEAGNRLEVNGYAPSGRCNTRSERFVLDRRDGRTLSRATTAEPPPQSGPKRGAPVTARGTRFEIVVSTEPDVRATLRATDPRGHVLWSKAADEQQPLSVLYADGDVVAIYTPGAGEPSAAGPAAAVFDTVVGVLDARTGRLRWRIRASALPLGSPQFTRRALFAIEGERVVVHAIATGAVLASHQLQASIYADPDSQLLATKIDDTVALVEGDARRLTLFDSAGTVRWKAILPRAMSYAQLTALDDTIYLAGGGDLGYRCGGE